MSMTAHCNICHASNAENGDVERATVRSNVRAFRDESFGVWRCHRCRSIHASDEVDLDQYYAEYPFHRQTLDVLVRTVYRNTLRRLKMAGLQRHHRLLDYGCGNGTLISYLRQRGYEHVVGYDAYSERHGDPSVLEKPFDFVHAQDVIEHVADPHALLRDFDQYARPGGIVVIGTPNAGAIHLNHANDYVHMLHQPYHTHILSKDALIDAGRKLGWTVARYYPTQYTNTLVPCLNMRFGLHYGKCFDNTIDLAFDGFQWSLKLLTPRSVGLALFGYFFCPETDIMVVFKTPADRTKR